MFRYSLGIFLTSIGIAWNEALYSFSILRNLSDYVLSFFPNSHLIKNVELFKILELIKNLESK
jgi:hypothetical protein